LLCKDIQGIVVPKIGWNIVGTFEKQASGLSYLKEGQHLPQDDSSFWLYISNDFATGKPQPTFQQVGLGHVIV